MEGTMETEKEIIENPKQVEGEMSAENSYPAVGEPHAVDSHGDELHDGAAELEEAKAIDFAAFDKKDFVEFLKEQIKSTDFKRIDAILRDVKTHYEEIRDRERAEALQRFLQDGGKRDDFEYRNSEIDNLFDANFKLLRDKRNKHAREQDDLKNENLTRKTDLLEKLRALVDSEDGEQSFQLFKEIQREWRSIGAIPTAQIKPLWASYTALVDRFYDHRSIYFELKELDRKKNLEAKVELCVRAEKLLSVEKLSDAVRELNELHNEFKHLGPVPKEDKESVWQRFKAASDALYKKRDEHLEKVNQELAKNLEEKKVLAEELSAFINFQSDRIKEWNQKTQEILAIQKKWETIGGVPRAKAKEVNKKFWAAFKAFFNAKGSFFKKLDEERVANLRLKEDLVKQAIELKQSSNWEQTAEALKELQRKWKEVGPVPEKMREKIFQNFKEACDYFFEQRRTQFGKQDEEQRDNLHKKEEVCQALESLAETKTADREKVLELVAKFNDVGFVPKKSINGVRTRFQKALEGAVASLTNLTEDERESLLLEAEVGNLKNDPQAERRIYQKEQNIRRKITKAENDLAVLKNNLEFFARAKNADKVRDEFGIKIKDAADQLQALKNQLKLLKTAS